VSLHYRDKETGGFMALFSKIKKGIGKLTTVDGGGDTHEGEKGFFMFPTEGFTTDDKEHSSSEEASDEENPYYTDGFEDIYSIENVDTSKIRRLGAPEDEEEQQEELIPQHLLVEEEAEEDEIFTIEDNEEQPIVETLQQSDIPQQDEPVDILDDVDVDADEEDNKEPSFSIVNDATFDALCLYEPINVLKLSQQAEQGFLDNGKKTIQDLVAFLDAGNSFIKGMGQGHIDEMKEKLQKHLGGQKLYNVDTFDAESFVHGLVGDLDSIKVSCFLETLDVACLWKLSREEDASLRHLNDIQKNEYVGDVIIAICSEEKKRFVINIWKNLVAAFITPWMYTRQGLATVEELHERLARKSVQPSHMAGYIDFFEETYFKNKDLFVESGCRAVDRGVYATDETTAQRYTSIVTRAHTYFYKRGMQYLFYDFIALLSREFAREWAGYPEGFIEKILKISPRFRVRKGADGALVIKQT